MLWELIGLETVIASSKRLKYKMVNNKSCVRSTSQIQNGRVSRLKEIKLFGVVSHSRNDTSDE